MAGSEVDQLAPAVAEVIEVMGDGPAAQEAGSHIAAVPSTARVSASPVADQGSDLPGHDGHRNGHRRRANPSAVAPGVSCRPPSDRAISDVLALVALSSRATKSS